MEFHGDMGIRGEVIARIFQGPRNAQRIRVVRLVREPPVGILRYELCVTQTGAAHQKIGMLDASREFQWVSRTRPVKPGCMSEETQKI